MKYHTRVLAKLKAYLAVKRTNTVINKYKSRFCGLFHMGNVEKVLMDNIKKVTFDQALLEGNK